MRKLNLLIVEDDAADQRLIKDALEDHDAHVDWQIVGDGTSALKTLENEGGFAADLVLLDLNLPCLTGREVLMTIRKTPGLRALPVVIHSTSDNPKDVAECYRLGANSYVVKATQLQQFQRNLVGLVDYWRVVTTLPVIN